MAFEDTDTEFESEEESSPPEETGNRAFLIVAGVLGAVALLALICIAVYALVFLPRQKAEQTQRLATLNAQNTQVAMAITQTSEASFLAATQAAATPTPTATEVIAETPTPTATAVVVLPTFTRPATQDPRTATVAALLTQASNVTRTVVPTATALPSTGFADEVGLPAMMGIAVLLIGVIFVARRLRSA